MPRLCWASCNTFNWKLAIYQLKAHISSFKVLQTGARLVETGALGASWFLPCWSGSSVISVLLSSSLLSSQSFCEVSSRVFALCSLSARLSCCQPSVHFESPSSSQAFYCLPALVTVFRPRSSLWTAPPTASHPPLFFSLSALQLHITSTERSTCFSLISVPECSKSVPLPLNQAFSQPDGSFLSLVFTTVRQENRLLHAARACLLHFPSIITRKLQCLTCMYVTLLLRKVMQSIRCCKRISGRCFCFIIIRGQKLCNFKQQM